jgi:uroporphyrinogen III methyltransferase / synthase
MVVFIVGAGPGDLGLVTLKAKELIERAEVLLYDKLANPVMLEWAPPGCTIIYVGKRESGSDSSQKIQSDINSLLVKYGRDKFVVRLKGGDPYIFGRGGEEAQICVQEGIPFETVPGISSCYAVPAYAGVPVSHRDFNSSFAVLTGHEQDKEQSTIDWVHLPETVVVLMGVSQIRMTATRLLEAGRDPTTPVAAIRAGTRPEQTTRMTTLRELADQGIDLKPPVIFVIGPAAKLHSELDWFGKKLELARGKRVVLTRAKGHEKESTEIMETFGFDTVSMPLIEIVDREFEVPDLQQYDALVLTSLEGVKRVAAKADLGTFPGLVFPIGPKTRHYLLDRWPGLKVSMGDTYNSRGLGEHILSRLPKGGRILGLRSSAASGELEALLEGSYSYSEIPIYDIQQVPADPKKLDGADAVFVVSASCALSISELDPSVFEGKTVVSIGPMTSNHLTIDHITARTHTINGMVDAYMNYLWTGYP